MSRLFSLRPARSSDAAAIARLASQLGYPGSAEQIAERLAILVAAERFFVCVAESNDGELLGWINAESRLTLESGVSHEIVGLVVDASQRRSGVGRALVHAAEEWAASRGATALRVRSNVTRVESHPFYESLGYSRQKTQHAYVKPIREE